MLKFTTRIIPLFLKVTNLMSLCVFQPSRIRRTHFASFAFTVVYLLYTEWYTFIECRRKIKEEVHKRKKVELLRILLHEPFKYIM